MPGCFKHEASTQEMKLTFSDFFLEKKMIDSILLLKILLNILIDLA